MKVYLDNCCLNRPFDDQSQVRVHLESEAVKSILHFVELGAWQLLSSDVLLLEIQKVSNEKRRRNLSAFEQLASQLIVVTESVKQRAKIFEQNGVQAFDALHLACAEGHADVFLTVDDRLIRKALQLPSLQVAVKNPLHWLGEVL